MFGWGERNEIKWKRWRLEGRSDKKMRKCRFIMTGIARKMGVVGNRASIPPQIGGFEL